MICVTIWGMWGSNGDEVNLIVTCSTMMDDLAIYCPAYCTHRSNASFGDSELGLRVTFW